MNLYFDSNMTDETRRAELYCGSIFSSSPTPCSLGFCRFAGQMIEEAFHPFDPMQIHEQIPADKCAEILATLKPKFIHHHLSKQYIRGMLGEAGFDLEQTYFDVPRLRTAFPGDYLKSGIAYAFHPHRDTWYSAPFCQINWWMPIFELNSQNCMAIHLPYFNRPVRNGSRNYNYHKWNLESRYNAAQHLKVDSRVQPHPEEPVELEPQLRMIQRVGSAFLFSAAHLHSTVPNTSNIPRYSIDFRTVHLADVLERRGAPNVDSECSGTTIGDYLHATDGSPLPQTAVALYQDGTELLYSKS